MRPKKIHLRLEWKEKETKVRKELWNNRIFVENPHLEQYGDYFNQYIEEKVLIMVIHHDTEPEVVKVLKAVLVAFSKKQDDIANIEISTDICLDCVEDGIWLTSLMPNPNAKTDYLYSVNLSHIANSNN